MCPFNYGKPSKTFDKSMSFNITRSVSNSMDFSIASKSKIDDQGSAVTVL